MRKLIFLFAFISTFIFGQTPDGSRKAWADTLKISRNNQFVDIMTVISDSTVSADGVTIANSGGTFIQKVFADTTALKAAVGAQGNVVVLKQISGSNTNGGGLFVWKTTGTADGGSTFAGSGGYWVRLEKILDDTRHRPQWWGTVNTSTLDNIFNNVLSSGDVLIPDYDDLSTVWAYMDSAGYPAGVEVEGIDFEAYLPDTIYVSTDMVYDIPYDNFVRSVSPTASIDFIASSDIPTSKILYFNDRISLLTRNTTTTIYTLTLQIYSRFSKRAIKTLTTKIKSIPRTNYYHATDTTKVQFILDSFGDGTNLPKFLYYRLSQDGQGGKIWMVGTESTDSTRVEATSGWSYNSWYSSASSPFYNGGSFDYANYLSTNNVDTADVVVFGTSINDIPSSVVTDANVASYIATAVTALKGMIDDIKTVNPNCKFGIALTPIPSEDDASANNTYPMHQHEKNLFRYRRVLVDSVQSGYFGSNVKYIPLFVDRVYGFLDNADTMPIMSRSKYQYVSLPGGGVHPKDDGYNQIADWYYAFIKASADNTNTHGANKIVNGTFDWDVYGYYVPYSGTLTWANGRAVVSTTAQNGGFRTDNIQTYPHGGYAPTINSSTTYRFKFNARVTGQSGSAQLRAFVAAAGVQFDKKYTVTAGTVLDVDTTFTSSGFASNAEIAFYQFNTGTLDFTIDNIFIGEN